MSYCFKCGGTLSECPDCTNQSYCDSCVTCWVFLWGTIYERGKGFIPYEQPERIVRD